VQRSLWILLSAVLALHAGCGDDLEPLEEVAPLCDQAAAAACLVNQHACELDGEAARCIPCELGQYATQSGTCAAIDGTPLHHAFSEFETASGEEVLGLCQSWTIGNDEELFVNAVELVQNEGSHHSNWTFVPEDRYEGPDGVWPCDARNDEQLRAALAGGVLYAQSTQAAKEVQKFPDGAVVRIPPRARIIGDVHILNPSDRPIRGRAEMTIYSLDPADVRVRLAPFHLTYDGLDIPPLDLTGATGLRFGCEFMNPRDESVGWGFGDQEMCEMLGFADMDIVFESRVEEANADGTDGDIRLFTGSCSTLAIRR
jgi:hypothetical protein